MAEIKPDPKSYGSADLDQILKQRRESLSRVRADLDRVAEMQKKLQEEQEAQKKKAAGNSSPEKRP